MKSKCMVYGFVGFFVLMFFSSFVSLSHAGALVYSTYLGGSSNDVGYGIAVDASGNAYVTGWTDSSDFPTTPSTYDTTYNGDTDVFVCKLNASGTALVYSTYLGGGSDDEGSGIAVDSSGNVYITGWTDSGDFPTTPGAWDTSFNGSLDVFVSKLNPSGTTLVYSTYLGGSNDDYGKGITVDASGNTYITGYTSSTDFATTHGAWDTTYNGDFYDVFVSKLNPSGTELIYSTYLGGSRDDYGHGIAVDTSGNTYITGETNSSNFPTTVGAFDTSWNGTYDVFVSKLNPSGTELIYSSYLGGNFLNEGRGITVDAFGNAYIIGWTDSGYFPTTPGAWDTTFNGCYDVFVSKLNQSGTKLVYSTYLGGSDCDFGEGIVVDAAGNAYITGETYSSNFPTTPGVWDTTFNGYTSGSADVFVSKLNPSGTKLVYSTYLGGSNYDFGTGIAIDASGNAYITGGTWSSDLPTTPGALDTSYHGGYDAFVSKLSFVPYFPPALGNIPDVKLLKGKSQTDVFQLNDYLQNTTSASWSWSSQSTFANLSIDSTSWVDYLTPLSLSVGQDTVTFLATNVGIDTSILKYSTYLLHRLPDAVIDNGHQVESCDVNLMNYLSSETNPSTPVCWPAVRYSDPADDGKLDVSIDWNNALHIVPTAALNAPAEVVVSTYPNWTTLNDWDAGLVHVSEIFDTYGEFSIVNDAWHYWFELPVSGAESLPAISWESNINGHDGVLRLDFSTASEGVKVVYNQELEIKPYTWYTMECAFASGAGAGNRHQVSGQLFAIDTLTGVVESGAFVRQAGQMQDTTWWVQKAYIYSRNNDVVKLRPMVVFKNNGTSGSMYLDYLRVYESKPMTERAYGALAKIPLSNDSFDNGLSGWFYELPAQGVDPSTPLPSYVVVSSAFGQENALAIGFTQATQGLKLTSDPVVNITPMRSIKLSWKAYSYENNPNRSLAGRIYCIDTANGENLSDAIGPSGLSSGTMPVGEWLTYTAVGTPLLNTETQARVQIVMKNGDMAIDSLYLDEITLEQENDSPYYWDHTLY